MTIPYHREAVGVWSSEFKLEIYPYQFTLQKSITLVCLFILCSGFPSTTMIHDTNNSCSITGWCEPHHQPIAHLLGKKALLAHVSSSQHAPIRSFPVHSPSTIPINPNFEKLLGILLFITSAINAQPRSPQCSPEFPMFSLTTVCLRHPVEHAKGQMGLSLQAGMTYSIMCIYTYIEPSWNTWRTSSHILLLINHCRSWSNPSSPPWFHMVKHIRKNTTSCIATNCKIN